MVKSRSTQPQVADMGQTSSQLGPPQPNQQPDMEDPRKSKGRKSRSKKSKRDEEVAERAALEEESARALMQLSSAGLHHNAKAPYYNQDSTLQAPAQIVPPVAQVQVVDQTHREDAEVEASQTKKKRRKKSERKKRRKPEEPEDFSFVNTPGHGLPSTPPSQRDRTPSPVNRPSPTQSTHPLDGEPSDNEMVQEYETGMPSAQQPHPTHHDIYSFSQQPPESLGPEVQEPVKFAYELPPGTYQSPVREKREKSSKKRKRQARETGGEEEQAWPNGQGDDMPIDPELHSIGALPPSTHPDPLDESGSEFVQEDQRRSKKHRNRRRVEQPQYEADDSDMYANAYNVDDHQGHQGDNIIQGLEDEKNQMSMELGTPYTEDTDVEDLRRQQKEANSKKNTKKAGGEGSGGRGGFSAAEVTKLDNFRNNYCQANEMNTWQFNQFIQANLRSSEPAVNIYNQIHELFPYRTRSSVQRFCRRRFHNFHARGVWTAEEDEDLKQAVAQKGTSWKVIGEMLGRFGEDCRDRYRNYLAPSAENRNKDAWTEAEVINLSRSILDCMRMLQHERQRAKEEREGPGAAVSETDSDQEADDLKLVNWQTVSNTMSSYGTARSRIQCSFKWGKIKKADRERYLKEIKEAQRNLRNLANADFTANNMKSSTGWRQKVARKKALNMKSGDQYDLLTAILDAAAPEEENIPWRLIGDDHFRQRWGTTERKAGWEMMRDGLQAPKNRDYRTVVRQLINQLLQTGVDERWDPEIHGWMGGPPEKRDRKTKKEKGDKGSKKHKKRSKRDGEEGEARRIRSSQYVHDSDEDEAPAGIVPDAGDSDAAGHNNREYNRFDALRTPGSTRRRVDGNHANEGEQPNTAGYDRSESPNSLFDGNDSATYNHTSDSLMGDDDQRLDFGGVSPDLAGRVRSLAQYAS